MSVSPSPTKNNLVSRASPGDNRILGEMLRRSEITIESYAEQIAELHPPAMLGETCWLCGKRPATHEVKCAWQAPKSVGKHWLGVWGAILHPGMRIGGDNNYIHFSTYHPVDATCGRWAKIRSELGNICFLLGFLISLFGMSFLLIPLSYLWKEKPLLLGAMANIGCFALGMGITALGIFCFGVHTRRLVGPLRTIVRWPVELSVTSLRKLSKQT